MKKFEYHDVAYGLFCCELCYSNYGSAWECPECEHTHNSIYGGSVPEELDDVYVNYEPMPKEGIKVTCDKCKESFLLVASLE